MRSRAREAAGAATQHGRRASALAQYLEEVSGKLAQLAQVAGQQVTAMAAAAQSVRGGEPEDSHNGDRGA
jgi:hypothetical protein